MASLQRIEEIEARHHACSYLPNPLENCTVCFLLAQLKDRDEKLAAVEALCEKHKGCEAGAYCTLPRDLDRILHKEGE